LFPVFLFLEVLGVRFLGRRKVRLEGTNPFPWPVEVRWRGLRVRRESGSTRITFPDGEEAVIPYAEAQVLVEQERDVRDRLL
jgi:hypothetical protein